MVLAPPPRQLIAKEPQKLCLHLPGEGRRGPRDRSYSCVVTSPAASALASWQVRTVSAKVLGPWSRAWGSRAGGLAAVADGDAGPTSRASCGSSRALLRVRQGGPEGQTWEARWGP